MGMGEIGDRHSTGASSESYRHNFLVSGISENKTLAKICSHFTTFNSIALRAAKTLRSFGCSECNMVNEAYVVHLFCRCAKTGHLIQEILCRELPRLIHAIQSLEGLGTNDCKSAVNLYTEQNNKFENLLNSFFQR